MTDLEIMERLELCYPGLDRRMRGEGSNYEVIAQEARGDMDMALRLCRAAFLEMACWDGESEPSLGEGDDLYAI